MSWGLNSAHQAFPDHFPNELSFQPHSHFLTNPRLSNQQETRSSLMASNSREQLIKADVTSKI